MVIDARACSARHFSGKMSPPRELNRRPPRSGSQADLPYPPKCPRTVYFRRRLFYTLDRQFLLAPLCTEGTVSSLPPSTQWRPDTCAFPLSIARPGGPRIPLLDPPTVQDHPASSLPHRLDGTSMTHLGALTPAHVPWPLAPWHPLTVTAMAPLTSLLGTL